MPNKIAIKEVARILRKGGKLGIIVNVKNTLPETKIAVIKLLCKYPNYLQKLMRTYLPKNSKSLAKLLKKYGFEILFAKDVEKKFYFEDEKEAVNFILSTGAFAGYRRMLKNGFEKDLAKLHARTVTHRFCIVIAKRQNKI